MPRPCAMWCSAPPGRPHWTRATGHLARILFHAKAHLVQPLDRPCVAAQAPPPGGTAHLFPEGQRLGHGKPREPRQPRHWLRLLYLFKLLLSLCKPLDFWRFDHASHSQARQHHTGDGLRCFQGMQRSFACCLDNCQLVQLVPGKPAAEVSITCNNSSTLYQGKGLYLTPSRFWI